MAMVAAAVANKGKLMKPQIWNRVIDPDGRVVDRLDPRAGRNGQRRAALDVDTSIEFIGISAHECAVRGDVCIK